MILSRLESDSHVPTTAGGTIKRTDSEVQTRTDEGKNRDKLQCEGSTEYPYNFFIVTIHA